MTHPGHSEGLAIVARQAHKSLMSGTRPRTCKCGLVYSRSEAMAASREIGSFECAVCGATMETWKTAWVPKYRLIAGPVRPPEK